MNVQDEAVEIWSEIIQKRFPSKLRDVVITEVHLR